MQSQMITLALSKGRIFEETVPLLKAAGIEVLDDPEKSRKLILETNQPNVRVLVVRATDVPTYVQYGGADMGITGKDTLLEHGSQGLYQPLDLQIAKCRISVAVRADFDYASAVKRGDCARIFCHQRRARRPDQALWQHGTCTLGGVGRCDCGSGVHGQHAEGESPDRGGAHHGHQFSAGRQSGGAQAETRAHSRHH